LGKNGGIVKETLKLEIETELKNLDTSLNKMRDGFSKLNLGRSMEKEVAQMFSLVSEKIKALRANTKDGVINIADYKQVAKDIETITTKLRQMGVNVDLLGGTQRQLKEAVPLIDKMTQARQHYNNELNKTLKAEEKAKKAVATAKQNKEDYEKDNLQGRQLISEEQYQILAANKKAAKREFTQATAELNKAEEAKNKRLAEKYDGNEKAKGFKNTNEYKNYMQAKVAAEEAAQKLSEVEQKLQSSTSKSQLAKEAQDFADKLAKAEQELKNIQQTDISANFKEVKQILESSDVNWKAFNVDISSINSIEDLDRELKRVKNESGEGANEILNQISKAMQSAEKSAGPLNKKLGETTTELNRFTAQKREIEALHQRFLSFFGMQNAIQLFKRAIREAYQAVKELDAAMTKTAVVTDFSVGDMWEQLPEYTKMANDLGTTTLGAYETATLFYQQGLKTNEVMEVSNETMKMARIAGMDYVDATNMMTAALRGFNMEINETSAKKVNDVYSELAKITASDTQEISTAMTKTASIAHNANMEFETTAAFLSQIIETTRESAETAGTAMKTIVARFTELKKNPNELVEVDGEQVDANKIETALKSVGVALRDSNGEFRKLDDVFLDLAKRWDSLTVNEQRYIATMAAGSRQQSRFIAMMSNYDRTIELVDAAYSSAGSSQEQFEKTTESLESKLNRLHNAWQGFTMGIANNKLIKLSVDILIKLATAINKVTEVGGEATSLIGKLGISLAVFKVGSAALDSFWGTFSTGLKDNLGPMKSFNEGLKSMGKTAGQTVINGLKQIPKAFSTVKQVLSHSPTEDYLKDLQLAIEHINSVSKNGSITIGSFKGVKADVGQLKELQKVLMSDSDALGTFSLLMQKNVTVEEAARIAMIGNNEEREKAVFAALFQKEALENLTDEQKEEIRQQMYSSANLGVQNKLRLQQVATLGLSKKGTAQLAEEAKNGSKVGSAALTKLIGLAANLEISLGALLGIIAGVTAALVGTGVLIYLNSSYKKLKDLNKELKNTEGALSTVQDNYKELLSDLDSYDEMMADLNQLVAGSNDWKDRLVEVNKQVDELLKKYPILADYTTEENGLITISSEGIELIKEQQREQIDNLIKKRASTQYSIDVEKKGQEQREKEYIDRSLQPNYNNNTNDNGFSKLIEGILVHAGVTPVMSDYDTSEEDKKLLAAYSKDLKYEDQITHIYSLSPQKISGKQQEYKDKLSGDSLDALLKEYSLTPSGSDKDKIELLYQRLTGLSEDDSEYAKRGKAQKEAVAEILANKDIVKEVEELNNKIATDATAIGEALRGNYDAVADATDMINNNEGSWANYSDSVKEYLSGMQAEINKTTEYFGLKANDEGYKDLKDKFGGYTEAVNAKKNIEKIQDSKLYGDAEKTIKSRLNAAIDSKSMSKLLDNLDQLGNIDYSSSINSYKTLKAIVDETDNAFKDVAFSMLQNISVADQMSEAFYGLSEDELKSFSEDPSAKQVLALSKTNEKVGQMLENTGTSFSAFGRILEQLQKGIISTTDLTDEYISALQKMYRSQDIIEDTFARIDDYNSSLTESQTAISDFYNSQRKEIEELYDKGAYGDKRLHQMIINLFGEDAWNEALEGTGYKQAIDSFMGKIKQLNGTFYQMFASLPQNNIWSVDSNGSIVTNLDGITSTQQLIDRFAELAKVSKQTAEAAIADLQTYSSDLSLQLQQIDYAGGMEDLLKSASYKVGDNWFVDLNEKQLAEYAPVLGINIEDPTVAAQEAKKKIESALSEKNDGIEVKVVPKIDNEEFKSQVNEKLQGYWDEGGSDGENDVSKSNFLNGDQLIIDPVIDSDKFQEELNKLLQNQYNYLTIECGLDPSEAKQELEQFWTTEKIKDLFPSVPPEQQEVITNQVTTAIADGSYNPVIEAQQEYMAAVQSAQMYTSTANGIITALNTVIRQFAEKHPVWAKILQLDKDTNKIGLADWRTVDGVNEARDKYNTALAKAKTTGKKLNTKIATTTPRGTTTSYTKPKGRTDTSSSSSSSSKEKTPWENPYDHLYNLTQKINTEIRKRNRLESEYNRLVQYGLGNAADLAKKTEQERKSLEQQKALQQQLLAERKKDVEKLNKNKYSKYARYDMATGNIVIDYNLINKNKDEDIGKGIEGQVSKLEELKGEIEGAEDALWEIDDKLYELTQRGRDEYINFQKDVYNALIKQRQDEIDKYSEYISTLAEAKTDILDALRKYIDKQRQERDNAEREKEIADKDAQLFRMERDTGSTQADIIAARKDVEQMRRDYTDELIDQKISELEEQNDEAQKVREKQLEIMQKQLEQDQESGALWEQVKTLMEEGWGPDGKIIEGSELERILTDYYEYTQMSEEERAKAIEQRNMNTILAKQYLDAKNAGKNTYKPSTSYPDVNKVQTPQNQTPKKNPTSNSGAKALTVGTRVRTVGFGNAASDGSGGRAAKGLSNRKILKIRKGAKYPYLIGTSNDPSGWTGWYTAAALQAYKKGGLANFTGPAWLDGTKSRPEAVLNARDTENFLQLRDILGEVLTKTRGLGNSNSENNGDNYYDIDIQVDRLSNDYDVDQLVRKIKKEITKDANYRNVRTINLKR
jgi:TP901 family phage tail tape measure protein